VFPVLRDRFAAFRRRAVSRSLPLRHRGCFLGAVAKPAGLVVVLDDVHRADSSSLELLEFIAGDLTDMGILVVAKYRDTEVEHDHPFAATLLPRRDLLPSGIGFRVLDADPRRMAAAGAEGGGGHGSE
jgi:predicted ATPase